MKSSATCEVRRARCEELCVSLSCATEAARVGGKAANLARLIALGIAVPDGEVLTAEAFARAHASPVLPDDVATAVEGLADRWLTHAPLVVRSSAIGEDGATASFAGQFDSILHVGTRDELLQAIRRCWASYASPRAEFYRPARGIAAGGMAVIIQRQVAAVRAGVLFTQAPTGAADEMLIEGCDGLADGLVSGRVEPWSVRAKKPSGGFFAPAAAVRPELPPDVKKPPDGFFALVNIAASIADAFGAPQDIEWAIDGDDRVWIVQTRPITGRRAQCDVRRATCVPTVLFSNANINENFPEPVSPLLYSIASSGYYHYFRNLGLAFGVSRARLRAMDQPLRSIIAVHGARMYYNLTSVHAVLRMAPCGEALAASFNEFVGADEVAAPLDRDARWHGRRSRVAQAFELARIVAATAWQYAWLRRRIRSFEDDADDYASRTRPADLESRSLADLNRHLVAFLDIRRDRWKNASLADAAAMVCYSLLQRTLAWSGAAPSLHNRLLRALPGVPSSQPPLRLWELSRQIRSDATLLTLFAEHDADVILDTVTNDPHFAGWKRDFARYLADWGFRSSRELMLTSPTLDESPGPAIDLLKQYVLTDSEAPAMTMARQAQERRDETRALWQSLIWRAPHKAVAVLTILRATQTAIAFRERARLKQALLYTRCRHVVRAIGRRLAEAGTIERQDDVFMLRWQEIDELVSGRAMFPGAVAALVAARAAEHARLSSWTPPDRIVLPEGVGWTPDAGASASG
ncbi:MAG TPA: PEP/pyruvate-binding domain-containing protein, partial [Vicinamibacterales bacterium]|nr:PEP/pyruvate-binding domain-containing protein [Vicinamibacterales bacterium]